MKWHWTAEEMEEAEKQRKARQLEFESEIRALVAQYGMPPEGYCFSDGLHGAQLERIDLLPHGRDGGCLESGCTCIPENLERILRGG